MPFSAASPIRKAIQAPLSRALLLSLALHLAVLGVIQVTPIQDAGKEAIIQVRLLTKEPGLPDVEPHPVVREEVRPPPAVSAPDHVDPPVPIPIEPAVTAAPAGPKAVPATAAKAEPPPAATLATVPSMVDLRWYGAREVDSHPTAQTAIEPVYPEAARRRGQTGWVKLRLKIDEYGGVKEAEVVEAKPAGVFDAATLEAFERARFKPAHKQGRPVRYEGYFRVVFELD